MNTVDVDRKADAQVTQSDLLAVPEGPRTEATLRTNCTVGVQYLEAWLGGMGCVPLDNLMEDAATAEICRTQVLIQHLSLRWRGVEVSANGAQVT